MSIEILSPSRKSVDKVQYLTPLSKAETGMVKQDADVRVAEANRDDKIRKHRLQTASTENLERGDPN
ncbi:flotillin-2-like [Anoplophora glabripennis]|uniref:flotillin-2-like n=1 Tax=Anoplophora glabripennis TaxID=217634 RepID=UPI000873E6E3|nr:flotillin-2-like [Anoplophora glabripennis]